MSDEERTQRINEMVAAFNQATEAQYAAAEALYNLIDQDSGLGQREVRFGRPGTAQAQWHNLFGRGEDFARVAGRPQALAPFGRIITEVASPCLRSVTV